MCNLLFNLMCSYYDQKLLCINYKYSEPESNSLGLINPNLHIKFCRKNTFLNLQMNCSKHAHYDFMILAICYDKLTLRENYFSFFIFVYVM